MNKTAFGGFFLIVLCGALLLRGPGLGLRPMHHDEANQAVKFGLLLEKGEYRYDPADHHGPALYYLTLPIAWAAAKPTLTSLDETTLRFLPVLFGVGIILLLLVFVKDMGRPAVLLAGLCAALSPALAFYSRFYIQEMIFVFFCIGFIGSIWRYLKRPVPGWATVSGIFAGLMYATKETSIIIFAAVAGALVLTRFAQKKRSGGQAPPARTRPAHLILALTVAVMTAALFFSSFLANPKGIVDSVAAFQIYFAKGGAAGFHAHPWWYYLGLLTRVSSGGLVWSEALVLALACLGILSAVLKRDRLAVFLSFYSILALTAFSLIRYKTPWNLLPFYAGFILLAGTGAAFVFERVRQRYLKIPIGLLLVLGFAHLGWQSYQANFRYHSDPRNPYVYAQTSPDYLRLVRRVDAVAALHPDHERLLIKVICGPYETWPLPWSLRRYERVGYWAEAPASDGFEDAPVVIASQDIAAKIGPLLKDTYQAEFYGLRPDVLLTLYIRNDLWDRFIKNKF
jgi:uncharacterized protein (TIGR03663 family)